MFSDGEAIYPQRYIEDLVMRMRRYGVAIASGVAEYEVSGSFSPRGSVGELWMLNGLKLLDLGIRKIMVLRRI
jgi:hypothetical protein